MWPFHKHNYSILVDKETLPSPFEQTLGATTEIEGSIHFFQKVVIYTFKCSGCGKLTQKRHELLKK